MKSLTIKARLVITLGVAILLLVAIGVMGVVSLGKVKEELRTVYEDRTIPLDQLAGIDRLILLNRLLISRAVLSENREVSRANAEAVEANIASISDIWDAYMSTWLTTEERRLADQFAAQRKLFVTQGLQPAIALLRDGQHAEARRHVLNRMETLRKYVLNERDENKKSPA